MIKGSIQQEDIIIINIHAPDICTQHQSTKICKANIDRAEIGEIDSNTIMGDFHTLLKIISRLSRQKTNKEIADLTTLYTRWI